MSEGGGGGTERRHTHGYNTGAQRTLVQQVPHKLVVGHTLREVCLGNQLVGLVVQVEVEVVAGQEVHQHRL